MDIEKLIQENISEEKQCMTSMLYHTYPSGWEWELNYVLNCAIHTYCQGLPEFTLHIVQSYSTLDTRRSFGPDNDYKDEFETR